MLGLEAEPHATPCLSCGSTRVVSNGRKRLRVRDLPLGGKFVLLDIQRRRLRCQDCGATFGEALPHVAEHRRATVRLLRKIEDAALGSPLSAVAARYGLDERTVRNVFRDYLTHLAAAPPPRAPEAPALAVVSILRTPRLLWINPDEHTVVRLDAEASPQAVAAALAAFAPSGQRVAVRAAPELAAALGARVAPWPAEAAFEKQFDRLEALLAGISRRTFDAVRAIVVLDQRLHKIRRKVNRLDYEKIDLGTSIPKLIERIEAMQAGI